MVVKCKIFVTLTLHIIDRSVGDQVLRYWLRNMDIASGAQICFQCPDLLKFTFIDFFGQIRSGSMDLFFSETFQPPLPDWTHTFVYTTNILFSSMPTGSNVITEGLRREIPHLHLYSTFITFLSLKDFWCVSSCVNNSYEHLFPAKKLCFGKVMRLLNSTKKHIYILCNVYTNVYGEYSLIVYTDNSAMYMLMFTQYVCWMHMLMFMKHIHLTFMLTLRNVYIERIRWQGNQYRYWIFIGLS